MNAKPSVQGREAREAHTCFFQQHLHLTLDRSKRSNRRAHVLTTTGQSNDTRLCLSLLRNYGSDRVLATWEDDDAQKLETRMTDIAIHVILAAEIHSSQRVTASCRHANPQLRAAKAQVGTVHQTGVRWLVDIMPQ
jgi:hypothetical protein